MHYAVENAIDRYQAKDKLYRDGAKLNRFWRPALAFEVRSGLSDIGTRYRMPEGITDAELARNLTATDLREEVARGFLQIANSLPIFSADEADNYLRQIKAYHSQAEDEYKQALKRQARGENIPGEELHEKSHRCAYFLNHKHIAKAFRRLIRNHPEITHADLQQAAQEVPSFGHALQATYRQLVELNPELNELTFDTNHIPILNHVIQGITSGFNIDDIRAYSIEGKMGDIASAKSGWRGKMNAVEGLAGTIMGWIPSEKTLDRALEQLQQREKTPTGRWASHIAAERATPRQQQGRQ